MSDEPPSRVRVALGAELRALRTMAGDSQREMARRAAERFPDRVLTQVHISRVEKERPERLPTRAEVDVWLDLYDPPTVERDRVLALLAAAHAETREWKDLTPGSGGSLQGIAGDQERAARLVRCFSVEWIHGLLQTPEYARQLIAQVDVDGVLDVARSVADRMTRQAALYEPGRQFRFLLAEAALHWAPGDDVMPAQLDRLLQVATLSTVELGVLPARRVGAASWHSFILFTPADETEPPSVATELVHGRATVVDPQQVAHYVNLWERLWTVSATGESARAAVQRVLHGASAFPT